MTFVFKIAFRYFFSKSEQTVINRINRLALFLVITSSCILFIVLSAFDGLKTFGLSFTNKFDSDYVVSPKEGKYFIIDSVKFSKLKKIKNVKNIAPEIEEKVFLSFKEKNQVAYLKGVEKSYTNVIPIDSLIMIGDWIDYEEYKVVLGYTLATKLSLGVYDYNSFLEVSVPNKKKSKIFNNEPFNTIPSSVVGLYQISEDLDNKYMFSSLKFAQELLSLSANEYSNLVINTSSNIDKDFLNQKLNSIIGSPVNLTSRLQKNAALYKMLNTENLAIYFIFTLVMIIALFNVIGSLIMMILDKSEQMKILTAMGVNKKKIRLIFFFVGLIICFIGGIIGITFGSIIVLIQYYIPFIYVPGTSLIYPVEFNLMNIFIVFGTLMFLGVLTSGWATRGIDRKYLF
jgi:lipoprotein-releasing system permease protein